MKPRAADLSPGTRFGAYEIQRVVGRGGMGTVYEATHVRLRKRVALKTMHPRTMPGDEAMRRFLHEGGAAARIRHPHVVDVSDLGVHEDVPFLVMEFLEGETLAAKIARDGAFSPADAAEIALPVLSALRAAHAANVVHRDLKPENVFLARDHAGNVHPKVLDFGISRVRDEQEQQVHTDSAVVFGTPHYMSPEQAVGGMVIDARADVYAAGVLLYESLTAKKPFHGETLFALFTRVVNEDPPPPSTRREGLSDLLDAVVLRAMARDRERRFGSAGELARAILPFATAEVRVRWEREFGVDTTVRRLASTAGESLAPSVGARGNRTLRASRARRGLTVSAFALVALGSLAGAVFARRATPRADTVTTARAGHATDARYELRLAVEPASAAVILDGEPAVSPPLTRLLARDGVAHTLRIAAPGYEPQTLTFRDAPPPARVALAHIPSTPPDPSAALAQRAPGPPPTLASAHPVHTVHTVVPAPPEPVPSAATPPRHHTPGANGSLIME